jgi:hypothetical protein
MHLGHDEAHHGTAAAWKEGNFVPTHCPDERLEAPHAVPAFELLPQLSRGLLPLAGASRAAGAHAREDALHPRTPRDLCGYVEDLRRVLWHAYEVRPTLVPGDAEDAAAMRVALGALGGAFEEGGVIKSRA